MPPSLERVGLGHSRSLVEAEAVSVPLQEASSLAEASEFSCWLSSLVEVRARPDLDRILGPIGKGSCNTKNRKINIIMKEAINYAENDMFFPSLKNSWDLLWES